jgi:hypothetical protein
MAGTGIGMSLFLIAVGAILLAAVDYTVTGIDIKAIGAILVGVGALGFLFSLVVVMGFFGSHASDDGHHTAGHV